MLYKELFDRGLYRKILYSILLFYIAFLCSTTSKAKSSKIDENIDQSSSGALDIQVLKIATHPALDSVVNGIQDELEDAGYFLGTNKDLKKDDGKKNQDIEPNSSEKDGEMKANQKSSQKISIYVKFDVESAQGNAALATQIAGKIASKHPTVAIGIGTGAAQALLPYTKQNSKKSLVRDALKIKNKAGEDSALHLIFSSITDPLRSKLITSLSHGDSNVNGVSNFVPLEEQLDLFLLLQPNLTKLGIVYNPSEINSVAIVEKLKIIGKMRNIRIVDRAITRMTEIPQVVSKLCRNEVDALFISNDNMALSAMPMILNIADRKKIPVYVSDTDLVPSGALAARGPNQYNIGRQTGKMIIRFLRGHSLKSMPVEFPRDSKTYINRSKADALGIAIPSGINAEIVDSENFARR